MTKRLLSVVLSFALLLSCVSGITMFTTADELPEPFGYFDFGGNKGATRASVGVVRYIMAAETNTAIRAGTPIGDTGLYGITSATAGRGLYFGGPILSNVPDGVGVTYAVEYYIDSETPLAGDVLLVTDANNGDKTFSDLEVGKAGVVFYTLSPAAVDALQGADGQGDTRLRMKVLGEGAGKLYITGVKILNSRYTSGAAAVPYSYYDFVSTVSCPYYPQVQGIDAYQLSYSDREINDPEGFEGYRYFNLTADAPAWAAEENVNKPVYVRFFTKEGHENTTVTIDSYQVYGEKKDGSGTAATHSTLIQNAPTVSAAVTAGVGGAVIPAAYLRNSAGWGSFRIRMSVAETIARVEVYDLTTYCGTEEADATAVEAMHAWRVASKWGVTTEGYQAPTLESEGNTGTMTCNTCGVVVAENQVIPQGKVYAQIDFSSGTAQSSAIKMLAPASTASVQKVPDGDEYALAVTQHNTGLKFALDEAAFAIDEEHLAEGLELAVTVEYYTDAVQNDATRVAFETADSKRFAFYKKWSGTCWDAACVNQSTPLVSGKTAIATFTVGKDVTYHAPQGQWSGADKITTPVDAETYTFAKNLVNGSDITLYVWGVDSQLNTEKPLYIKSITVFNAAELGGGEGGEDDHYYVNFEGVVTNPYYPEYLSMAGYGLTTASDCVEWYEDTDTEKQYPRFNYTYVRVPAELLTTAEDLKATPVKLVIERKEGCTATGMEYQYQIGGPGPVWSRGVTVEFDENGRYEATLLDAAFFNTLNSQSSIRLRDVHYERAGDADNGYTYTTRDDDDLDEIAVVRVYDLRKDCETYHDQFTEANKNLVWVGRVESTYEQGGFSGNLVCAHCGALFQEGEELEKLGDFAKLDFSSGTLVKTAIKGVRPIDGNTSLAPVQIPGTDSYGLKLVAHNSGLALNFSEFGHFTAEDIANGREIAVSVEYYIPTEVTPATRIVFDPQKGSDKIMALYTNYSGVTWDAAALNANAPMVREQLNVATFTVGQNVDYVTGPGQFSAANKFAEPKTVNTNELANAIISGGEILLRGWGVDPAKADDPTTEENETAPERAVYIKSITVYDAKDVAVQEIDTSIEFIDYTTEFVASPVYYPQYAQYGSAYGIAGAQVTEQGSVETGDDITYVYFGVTDSLKSPEQDVKPVVMRFFFKEGVERTEFTLSYQTAAPWTHIPLEIVDGMAEAVLEDAAFTNGLNGRGSFRISNYSTDPIVDDIARIEIYVIKDKTALKALLAEGAEITKYKTPDSIKAYNAVVADIQPVLDNVWATDEEIAEAVAALEEAAAALVDCDHACGTKLIGYKAETCLADGYSGDNACIDCGYIAEDGKGTAIEKHTTEIINVSAATCEKAGNTGDLWCTVCEKIAKPGNTITKLPHTWNEGEVTKEATIDEYGEFTKTCTVCGEKLVTRLEFVPQIGDVNGDAKIDSTDARLVLQFAVRKIAPTELILEMADVDGNEKVDSTDARLILQYAVRKIDKLPAAE